MITDEERREVAAKLRKVNPYRNQSYTVPYNRYTPAAEYLSELAGALGYSPKNDVSRLEFQSRLADLIEPPTKCPHYRSDRHYCSIHDVPAMDRAALLELVKELELGAQCFVGRKWPDVECERAGKHLADDYEMIARRIREALGVER